MNTKAIGGILLIVGTSIGAGMLALPMANAGIGFSQSTLYLFFAWLLMTIGAWYILEVTLFLPKGKHMVSMADATLGTKGAILTWITYLFLLYTLLSAYLSGGTDVLEGLLSKAHFALASWQTTLIFVGLFGAIVLGGIRTVDWGNRILMFGKMGIYLILITMIMPHIQTKQLITTHDPISISIFMLYITSFGFAIIIPNLRDYFHDDLRQLKIILMVGSFIPLLCYIIWNAVIIGSLPHDGAHGLLALAGAKNPTTMLANLISQTIQKPFVTVFFNMFTSICMLTAFLSVSLCLHSFLKDGLKLSSSLYHECLLAVFTFAPPLGIVIYAPGIYLSALSYAGIFCVILLLFLPTAMSYYGRKTLSGPFYVPGKTGLHIIMILSSLILLGMVLYNGF